MKNTDLMDELTRKTYEISDMYTLLEYKQEERRQLNQEVSEKIMQIEKLRKKGIPHCNRSFLELYIRLKPQFTCLTLKPLFEECPELEVIIADMAKKSFYKKMIQLQNF